MAKRLVANAEHRRSIRDPAQQLSCDSFLLGCNDDLLEIFPLTLVERKRTETHRSKVQQRDDVRLVLQQESFQFHRNQTFPGRDLHAVDFKRRSDERLREFWCQAYG